MAESERRCLKHCDINKYNCNQLPFSKLRTEYQQEHGRVYDNNYRAEIGVKRDLKSFFNYVDRKEKRVEYPSDCTYAENTWVLSDPGPHFITVDVLFGSH
jgi:hypothetical protein